MRGMLRKVYSPILFDVMFGLAGALGLVGVVIDVGRAYPAIAAADEPLVKGGAVIGTILAAGLIAIATARFDQKHADDFLFHTLTKSAFIGMFLLLFTAVLWELLLAGSLGTLSFYSLIGVLTVSWSIGYFYTRLRGTGAAS